MFLARGNRRLLRFRDLRDVSRKAARDSITLLTRVRLSSSVEISPRSTFDNQALVRPTTLATSASDRDAEIRFLRSSVQFIFNSNGKRLSILLCLWYSEKVRIGKRREEFLRDLYPLQTSEEYFANPKTKTTERGKPTPRILGGIGYFRLSPMFCAGQRAYVTQAAFLADTLQRRIARFADRFRFRGPGIFFIVGSPDPLIPTRTTPAFTLHRILDGATADLGSAPEFVQGDEYESASTRREQPLTLAQCRERLFLAAQLISCTEIRKRQLQSSK